MKARTEKTQAAGLCLGGSAAGALPGRQEIGSTDAQLDLALVPLLGEGPGLDLRGSAVQDQPRSSEQVSHFQIATPYRNEAAPEDEKVDAFLLSAGAGDAWLEHAATHTETQRIMNNVWQILVRRWAHCRTLAWKK